MRATPRSASCSRTLTRPGRPARAADPRQHDLSPTVGDLLVLEYSEERPPLLMSKGTTARIVNYYRGDRARCPISAGGGDRPLRLRKRHGDQAAQQSAADDDPGGRTAASQRVEERPPRLVGPDQYGALGSVADLIGLHRPKKKSGKEGLEAKKAKENAIDMLPEGVTEILHQKVRVPRKHCTWADWFVVSLPVGACFGCCLIACCYFHDPWKVHGPFVGEVEEGRTQGGLIW